MLINFVAPPPPSDVTLTVLSPTSIFVDWDSVSGATGYKITFAPVEGECEAVTGGSVLLESADSTSHTLQGLEEFVEYSVVVQSQGADGVGVPSTSVSVTTRAAGMD